jgi:hypothetical protein
LNKSAGDPFSSAAASCARAVATSVAAFLRSVSAAARAASAEAGVTFAFGDGLPGLGQFRHQTIALGLGCRALSARSVRCGTCFGHLHREPVAVGVGRVPGRVSQLQCFVSFRLCLPGDFGRGAAGCFDLAAQPLGRAAFGGNPRGGNRAIELHSAASPVAQHRRLRGDVWRQRGVGPRSPGGWSVGGRSRWCWLYCQTAPISRRRGSPRPPSWARQANSRSPAGPPAAMSPPGIADLLVGELAMLRNIPMNEAFE